MPDGIVEIVFPDRAAFAAASDSSCDASYRHAKRDVWPVVGAVWAGRGQRSVADLCRETGVTERTLERTFQSALGDAQQVIATWRPMAHRALLSL